MISTLLHLALGLWKTTDEPESDLPDSDIQPAICPCSSPQAAASGRNLVVCIDGTSNQFSTQNTNIVELYSRLVKNDDQLTYYNSGIGTYVRDSDSWLSWGAWKQSISHYIDQAFATNFKLKVHCAYRWLCDNYQPGDKIFLFGFSRGAYQVRVIAGMIEKVGLLYKGNTEQIGYAYDLYIQTIGTRKREDLILPELKCKRFKEACSQHVKTHFVGAWDTVSSIGLFRGPNLPETTTGMRHVCAFRHALALDEVRVKFLPEYANGGADPGYKGKGRGSSKYVGDVKEVWFAGSHSDIGGGKIPNLQLDHFGPSLRWISYEAIKHGLKIKPHDRPWETFKPEPAMNWFYKMLEYLPISRLSYTGPENIVSWPPPLQTPRKILPGQLIHGSVFDFHLKKIKYKPIALFGDHKLVWNEQLLRAQGLIEDDLYVQSDHILNSLREANRQLNRLSDEDVDAFIAWSSTAIGCQSIAEFSGSQDILIIALELESQRLGKGPEAGNNKSLAVALVKALNDFDTLPPSPDATYNPTLWSIVSELYPKSSSERFKFCDRFGPPACAIFIGIDTYQSNALPNLTRCAENANVLASFFSQSLGLSKAVILNEEATHATIIRAISNLASNDSISRDDPIVIFFAGRVLLDNNRMASIIPFDYPQSQSISSDTLNDLIAKVAIAKGNNITLIMDCDYAGAFGSHPYTRSNTASHVLLAGCGKGENTNEGWFSMELFNVLRKASSESNDGAFSHTYQDIVNLLPARNQTPQCIGDYTDCFLFSTQRSPICPISYEVYHGAGHVHPLCISAGEVHGITEGAAFQIQAQQSRKDGDTLPSFSAFVDAYSPYAARLYCSPQVEKYPNNTDILSNDADLLSSDTNPDNIWFQGEKTAFGMASLIHAGVESEMSVAVKTDNSSLSMVLLKKFASRVVKAPCLKYVSQDEPHQLLMLVWEGTTVAFDVVSLDGTVQRIPTSISDLESLFSVLGHVTHFFWHLRRSSESEIPIDVKAWALRSSDKNISLPNEENLVQDRAIRISVRKDDDKIKVLFKIDNASRHELYAWAFAFDPLRLSVETLYKPPFQVVNKGNSMTSTEACLRPFSGYTLFSTTLELPLGTTLTYLKVFLSNRWVNLSHMEMGTPFDSPAITTNTGGHVWANDTLGVHDPFLNAGTRLKPTADSFNTQLHPMWVSFVVPIYSTRETPRDQGSGK